MAYQQLEGAVRQRVAVSPTQGACVTATVSIISCHSSFAVRVRLGAILAACALASQRLLLPVGGSSEYQMMASSSEAIVSTSAPVVAVRGLLSLDERIVTG